MLYDNIDFDKETPFYNNGVTKWYYSPYFMGYIREKNGYNLPILTNLNCCIVKGNNIFDYVLIDNIGNIIDSWEINSVMLDQIIAKINILKVSKYYDECEAE